MRQLPPGTRALRSFEAAGRHLNFTRAADELGLTPAAVSHQIKEMEEQLGLVLFTRNSRSMQLTPAGSVPSSMVRTVLPLASVTTTFTSDADDGSSTAKGTAAWSVEIVSSLPGESTE